MASKKEQTPGFDTNTDKTRRRRREEYIHRIENPAPISPEYIRNLFSSDDFKDILAKTYKQFVSSHGKELGFVMIKDPKSDQTWYSKKPVASTRPYESATDLGGAFESMRERLFQRDNIYGAFMSSFHFHPEAIETDALAPSEDDLKQHSNIRLRNREKLACDIMPIDIVAATTLKRDEIFLLFYREPERYSLGEMPNMERELGESLFELQDQEECLNDLRHYGYIVELIKTVGLQIAPEDIQKLDKFAYTPKKL